MYVLKNESVVTANGYPFKIPNPDPAVIEAAQVAAKLDPETKLPTVDAELASCLIWFVGGLPWKLKEDTIGKDNQRPVPEFSYGYEEQVHIHDTIRACRDKTKGAQLVFEDATHKWLVETLKKEGPSVMRNVTVSVVEALEKAEQKAPKVEEEK